MSVLGTVYNCLLQFFSTFQTCEEAFEVGSLRAQALAVAISCLIFEIAAAVVAIVYGILTPGGDTVVVVAADG